MPPGQQGNGDGLYVRLEVLPGASHDEIARAYRRLAHDAHPDAHPGDPDAARRFREITEAYEVLGDPDRRERYDRARHLAGPGTDWRSAAPGPTSSRPGRAPTSTSPTVTGGPLVFLGTRPVTSPSAQLSVGPVEVEARATRPAASLIEEDFAAALLARLLSDVFWPRWRY
jgi:curved DNA-binding protein CbpA